MPSPEEIIKKWLMSHNPSTNTMRPISLAEVVRAYGDERARQERERCVRLLETLLIGVCTDKDAQRVCAAIRALD